MLCVLSTYQYAYDYGNKLFQKWVNLFHSSQMGTQYRNNKNIYYPNHFQCMAAVKIIRIG